MPQNRTTITGCWTTLQKHRRLLGFWCTAVFGLGMGALYLTTHLLPQGSDADEGVAAWDSCVTIGGFLIVGAGFALTYTDTSQAPTLNWINVGALTCTLLGLVLATGTTKDAATAAVPFLVGALLTTGALYFYRRKTPPATETTTAPAAAPTTPPAMPALVLLAAAVGFVVRRLANRR